MAKTPKTRRSLKPKHRRAAKAIAQGRGYREAGRRAGLKGPRAEKGVTVTEWMKLPAFRDMVKEYAEKAMTGEEWDERNAAQARGLLPSRIILNGRGEVTAAVIDVDRAMDRQGNALGKLKDRHVLTGPNGGAVQHEHSNLTDDELKRRLNEHIAAINAAGKEKRARQ